MKIDKKDEEFLVAVANKMNAQNNRMTDSPLFCVMDRRPFVNEDTEDEVNMFVGRAFFTAEAAEKHIENYRHHYNKPYVFAFSSYEAPEMRKVMRIISQMGDSPNTNAYPPYSGS